MIQINPYIGFNGSCEQAMNFYKGIFGGELTFMKVGESPVKGEFPAEMQDKMLHSMLQNGPFVLMGTDCNSPEGYRPGNNFSIALDFSSEAELRNCFDALKEGGTVFMPVEKQFWGDIFGMVIDQFGLYWNLSFGDRQHPE